MFTQFTIGTTVNGYELQRELGKGSLGTVFLAKQHGCNYAIKVLKHQLFDGPDGIEYAERFHREAETASLINHKNVVRVIEYGFAGVDKVPYLVMEYVPGITLEDLIGEHDCLDYRDRTVLIRQIAGALSAIHKAGLVHRDVKPSNVLISRSLEAKITDFGIVQVPDSELTLANHTLGTPAYMSPESFKTSRIDCRADIFSLGALTYELMMGRHPFKSADVQKTMEAIIRLRPLRPRKVDPKFPAQLQRIMSFMLKKNCEVRYQSADELIRDLDDFLRGKSRWKGLIETVAGRMGMSSNWS